jgi:hypothetical protein
MSDQRDAEIERLRNALAGISLISQDNTAPAHVLLAKAGREARDALAQSST